MKEWVCADDCNVRRYIRDADCIVCSERTSREMCVNAVPAGKSCRIINIKTSMSLDGAKKRGRKELCLRTQHSCPAPIPCLDIETNHTWYSNLTRTEIDICNIIPLHSDEVNYGTVLAVVVVVLLGGGFFVGVNVCVHVRAREGSTITRSQRSDEVEQTGF